MRFEKSIPADPLAWAREELARRAHDEAALAPTMREIVSGRDPVARARCIRRRAAGLTRTQARACLAQAAAQTTGARHD